MQIPLDLFMDAPRLQAEDTFRFRCSRCGTCCRDVRQAINLNTLDLFRIARHLGVQIEDVVMKHSELIEDSTMLQGFPLLMMKAREHQDACVFLRKGVCSIQEAKPIVCKLYPLNVGPDDKGIGRLSYFKVSRRMFHYTGDTYTAGEWMDANLSEEYRRFIPQMYQIAADAGKLVRRIKKRGRISSSEIGEEIVLRMYILYDAPDDFWPQWERNTALLLKNLERMASQ